MKKASALILCILLIFSSSVSMISAAEDDPYAEIYYPRDFKFERFNYSSSVSLPYRIFIPRDYDPNKSYPLILTLHGGGESGTNNQTQLTNIVPNLFNSDNKEAFESIVVAPQSPGAWGNGGYGAENDMSKALVGLIEKVEEKYSVDKSRVYAIGLSNGGYGVWDLLIRHNDMFAAGIPICGGADTSKAAILTDTPIYAFHGSDDQIIPVSASRNIVNAIKAEGGTQIIYKEFRGMGHNVWNTAMTTQGLLDWMFSQSLADRYPDRYSRVKIEANEIEAIMSGLSEKTGIDFTKANGYNKSTKQIVRSKSNPLSFDFPEIRSENTKDGWKVTASYFDEETNAIYITEITPAPDTIVSVSESHKANLGDINTDGQISALDDILLVRYLAGWYDDAVINDAALSVMDINGDKNVSAADCIILERYLAGWNVSKYIK